MFSDGWGLKQYQGAIKDSVQETKRYQALLLIDEISRALGRPGFLAPSEAAGKPALVSAEIPGKRKVEREKIDQFLYTDGKPSSAFMWCGKSETFLRSVAISEQEFYAVYQPRQLTVSVACRKNGLELTFFEKGRQRKKAARSRQGVEQEDGFRFVFEPQGSTDVYSFAVDDTGRSVCWKNGRKIPARFQISTDADENGLTQRIVLPWRTFGRKEAPKLERWRFNAGRFYRNASKLATWTPTPDELECNSGYLVFDPAGAPSDSVNIGNVYPGRNRLNGVEHPVAGTLVVLLPAW